MRLTYRTIVAALALTTGLALPRTSAAQQGQKSPTVDSVKVDNALMKKFVAAYPEITAVEKRVQQQMASHAKPAATQKMRMQAQEQIQQIFRKHDLTLAQYKAVVQKLNSDPALRKQFLSMLKGEKPSTSGGGGSI